MATAASAQMYLIVFSYLSESWYVLDNCSVRLEPRDLWHGCPPGLADDLSSCGVGEIHLVGRFLDEHRTRGVGLGEGWKKRVVLEF